eukprot:scaffold9330_cov117-Isochrysis_galbana.AAC.7
MSPARMTVSPALWCICNSWSNSSQQPWTSPTMRTRPAAGNVMCRGTDTSSSARSAAQTMASPSVLHVKSACLSPISRRQSPCRAWIDGAVHNVPKVAGDGWPVTPRLAPARAAAARRCAIGSSIAGAGAARGRQQA